MSIPLSLSGKVALITGGSRGIGAATVRLFTAAGARVVFSYQKARSQAEALAKECGEANCHAIASSLDSAHSARGLVAEAVKHFGRLDILVANHGVWPAQDVAIEKMTEEQWRSTLSINLDAVFGLVKYSVAQMKAQPRTGSAAGHIVLISSTSGQRGEAFHCDYFASKGALISMVKGLSTELASAGIPTVRLIGNAAGACLAGIVANMLGFARGVTLATAEGVAVWLFAIAALTFVVVPSSVLCGGPPSSRTTAVTSRKPSPSVVPASEEPSKQTAAARI